MESQPAVQHPASHCNQRRWSDGCSDAPADCCFAPLLPNDVPRGLCLYFDVPHDCKVLYRDAGMDSSCCRGKFKPDSPAKKCYKH